MEAGKSWNFQHLAQCLNYVLLYTAVLLGLMTMAFVYLNEFISIFCFFRIAVIWISSPELSSLPELCHAYMCSYVGRKFIIKILVSSVTSEL